MKNLSFVYKRSFIIGFLFCSVGVLLCLQGMTRQGLAFFFFLPLVIGISSGLLPDFKKAIWGTILSLFLFALILILTSIEGLICVLMSLPILAVGIGLGYLIGSLFRKNNKGEDKDLPLHVSLLPFLIFLAVNGVELSTPKTKVMQSVSTTFIFNESPERVFDKIIAVDTVDVPLNTLQYVGLPIPRKCVLSKAEVGGLRTCQFEDGVIVECIKELNYPSLLKMDVVSCELSRKREWLTFNEDIYTIKQEGEGKTSITRTTSYYSDLKPRIYWELMEELTIKSEQDFVFRNLAKDLEDAD